MRLVILVLALVFSFSAQAAAYPTPLPSSVFVASQDIVATSSDTHSVGVSSNFWRSGFFRNVYLPYRAEAPAAVASMGVVYASTDGNLYFMNAAGTTEKITNN